MDELDKRMLAKKAREVSGNVVKGIGANTPVAHAAALLAVAESWKGFADILERELPPRETRNW